MLACVRGVLPRLGTLTLFLPLLTAAAVVPLRHNADSKIALVKREVRERCGKELLDVEVVDAVVRAYDCRPASMVRIGECRIKCMKPNSKVLGSAGRESKF